MFMQPTHHWVWKFCEQQQRIVLDMSDEFMFVSHYPVKKLNLRECRPQQFSITDSDRYHRILEGLGMTELSVAAKLQVALNGIAALNYHKPLMAQGWYFREQAEHLVPELGMVIGLETLDARRGCFLVLDCDQNTSLCLLLDEQINLNGQKHLEQFDLIKVMNNRLSRPLMFSEDWMMPAQAV